MKKILRFIRKPALLFLTLGHWGVFNWMSDELYLRIVYRIKMGMKLNLKNPKTYNEKLQWLKLHDRRPEYTMMADKYAVRKYIADAIGEEYLIPLLGVWDRAEEIDFDQLPDRFALKCNHNSGRGLCLCKDKANLDFGHVRKELARGLKQDYYLNGREWPYKNIERKIIAEEFIEDPEQPGGIVDYKFMCFNGEPRCVFVCTNRNVRLHITVMDLDWKRLPFSRRRHPVETGEVKKPENFDRMVEIARTLSKDIPFVRVDFYECCGKVYVGELTFFPAGGTDPFEPEEWDLRLGEWLDLSGVNRRIISEKGK